MPPSGRHFSEDNRRVIGRIAVAAGGSLNVLYRGVGGRDLAARDVGGDEHLDFVQGEVFLEPGGGPAAGVCLVVCRVAWWLWCQLWLLSGVFGCVI